MKPLTEEDIIQEISLIRVRNNKNWMDLLRLALKAEPIKAKKILAQITKNDREISKWTARLS